MRKTIFLTYCLLLCFFAVVFASQPTTHKVKSRTTNKGIAGAELSFFEGTKRTRVTTDENGYAKRFSLPFSHGRTVRVRIEAEGYFPSESTCVMPECMDQDTYYMTEKAKHSLLQDNIIGKWGSKMFAVRRNGGAWLAVGQMDVSTDYKDRLFGAWRQEYINKNEHQIVEQDCKISIKESKAFITGYNPRFVKGSEQYNADWASGAYRAFSQTIVGINENSADVEFISEFDKKRCFKIEQANGPLNSRIPGRWCAGIYYQGIFYLGELIVESANYGVLLLRYTKDSERYYLDQEVEIRVSANGIAFTGKKAMRYAEKGGLLAGSPAMPFSFKGKISRKGVVLGNIDGNIGHSGTFKMMKLTDCEE